MFGVSTAAPFRIYKLRGRKNYDNFLNAIFPEDFNDFSQMIDYDFYKVRFCPKCWADGYHSYLHNLSGAVECPFHHSPLVDTNLSYEYARGITICDKGKSISQDDAIQCILPCYRQHDDSFYDIGLPQIEEIYALSTTNNNLKYTIKPFLSSEGYSKSFAVKSYTGKDDEYRDYLMDDIDRRNIHFCPCNNDPENCPRSDIKITKEFLESGLLQKSIRPDIILQYNNLCLFSELERVYKKYVTDNLSI